MSKNQRLERLPWVDKYRPLKLNEILSQSHVIEFLNNCVQKRDIPHLLFYGQSGVGKCFHPDTKIYLHNGGIKKIKNILPGDILIGKDGEIKKYVTSTIRGHDQLYEISSNLVDSVIVNSEHILCLVKIHNIVSYDNESKWWMDEKFDIHKLHHKNQNLCHRKENNVFLNISVKNYLGRSNVWKMFFKGYRAKMINSWEKKQTEEDPLKIGESINGNANNIPSEYIYNDLEGRIKLIKGFLTNQMVKIDTCLDLGKLYLTIENVVEKNKKNILNQMCSVMNSAGIFCKKVSDSRIQIIDQSFKEFIKISECSNLKNFEDLRDLEKRYLNLKDYSTNNYYLFDFEITENKYDEYCGFTLKGTDNRFLLDNMIVTHNTSAIQALAYEFFGPRVYKDRVLELNASDERGISVVRNKLTSFAKKTIGNRDPKYPCPNCKLIILDEADAMTNEAQSALRKVMEMYSDITRFCLICNYKTKITKPILSRCAVFGFRQLEQKNIIAKMRFIADKENLKISDDNLNLITSISKGDMRKSIIILQNLKYIGKDIIEEQDIYDASNTINKNDIQKIINLCVDDVMSDCEFMENLNKSIKDVMGKSYPIDSILNRISEQVIDLNIDEKDKAIICLLMSISNKQIIDGGNERLQILKIFMFMRNTIKTHTIEEEYIRTSF